MAQLSLGLLGSFEMRAASGSTALAPGKKIQALLAILGVRPGQVHSRSRLASLLWADVGEEQARHRVRQAALGGGDGSLESAIASASRLVMLDPTRETTHRTLIRLYLDTGRRDAAVRQYHACGRVLARELGMRPDAETRALYEKIVASRAVTAPAANGRLTPAAVLIVEDEP